VRRRWRWASCSRPTPAGRSRHCSMSCHDWGRAMARQRRGSIPWRDWRVRRSCCARWARSGAERRALWRATRKKCPGPATGASFKQTTSSNLLEAICVELTPTVPARRSGHRRAGSAAAPPCSGGLPIMLRNWLTLVTAVPSTASTTSSGWMPARGGRAAHPL